MTVERNNHSLDDSDADFRKVLVTSGMSHDFLHIAHELVGIGSYVINLRTRMLYGSAEMAQLLGCGDGPMCMQYDEYRRRFYAPDDYARVSQTFNTHYESGLPVQLDTRLVRTDGREIWVRTASVLRTDDAGDPVRVGMLQNITEAKQAEDALRKSETRFRSAFMTGALAFVIVEESTGKILEVNDHFLKLYRYTREEVVGRTSLELGMWAIPEERQKLLARLQEDGRIENFEVLAQRKGGDRFWVLYSVNRLDISGTQHILGAILDITERKKAEEKITAYVSQLEGMLESTLHAVSSMVEMRDPYTAGHERRVGIIAADIAREMGWTETRCRQLAMIGLVHDIGKIAIPAEILTKPGRLTPLEFEMIKTHAARGKDILAEIRSAMPIAEIVHQHHERMDGSGYPQGIKGEQILIEAQILAVADVLESMASHRPYRPAFSLSVAIDEIETHRGRWFDENVVDAVLRLIREKGYKLPT